MPKKKKIHEELQQKEEEHIQEEYEHGEQAKELETEKE